MFDIVSHRKTHGIKQCSIADVFMNRLSMRTALKLFVLVHSSETANVIQQERTATYTPLVGRRITIIILIATSTSQFPIASATGCCYMTSAVARTATTITTTTTTTDIVLININMKYYDDY